MAAIFTNSWLLLASACAWHFGATVAMSIRNFGIYGGTPVNITEVPFMAIFTTAPHTHYCGASIVHEQFLVSAAHCVNPNGMLVYVATDNINEGVRYDIDKVMIHPKYNEMTIDYDISVIKLKNKLTLNDRVQPIKMADSSVNPSPGEMMATIGFGETEDERPSPHLLKVNIPFVDRDECAKRFRKGAITDRMICAGGEAGKDKCYGDSGGPLFYKGQLIGVVSWGSRSCGRKGYPGVYADVPSMRNFTDDAIKKNS